MNKLCLEVTEQLGEGHIMLSYNWASAQKLCQKVYDSLTHYSLPIWMDKAGGIHGSIAGSMADAVENAAVIIPFMTEQYQESKACNQEIEYANDLGVKIVPIRAQKTTANGKPYRAKGKLGILTAGKLYIDFTNDDEYEQKVSDLIISIASSIIDPEKVMKILRENNENNGEEEHTESDYDHRIPIRVITKEVEISSLNHQYSEVDFEGPILCVSLIEQFSKAPCVYTESFGFIGNRVWVDNGARGKFRVLYTPCRRIKVVSGQENHRTIVFQSMHYKYKERIMDKVIKDVELVKQLSKASCIKNETFGFKGSKIWADKGA